MTRLRHISWRGIFTVSCCFIACTGSNNSPEKDLDSAVYRIKSKAEFAGGRRGLHAFLDSAIVYPLDAQAIRMRNTVTVDFVVDSIGQIRTARTSSAMDTALARVAKRIVSSMPQWTPALLGDSAITSYESIDIVFYRSEEDLAYKRALREDSTLNDSLFPSEWLNELSESSEAADSCVEEFDIEEFDYGNSYDDDDDDGISDYDYDVLEDLMGRYEYMEHNGIAYFHATVEAPYDGGLKRLHQDIQGILAYPESALRAGRSGAVSIGVYLDDSGAVIHTEVVRAAYHSLNKEALRIIDALDEWTPLLIEGVAVHSAFLVQVPFELN